MCPVWEDNGGRGPRGRECLRSRMILSRVLCWEDLTEPQVVLKNMVRVCSAEKSSWVL